MKLKIFIKKIPFIFLFFNLLSSCTHYYYVPNSHNVTLFKEKNEFRGTVAIGGEKNKCLTTELQTAYSITDNLAVMSNFSLASNGLAEQGFYLDGAVGYFKPINDFFIFEIYGGLGNNTDIFTDISYLKFYAQPNIGVSFNTFDAAFSTRVSNVYFYDIYIDSIYNESLDLLNKNRNSILIEPAITLRAGWKFVKLQLQFVYSLNINNPQLNFQKTNLSFGIYFSFAERYLKKKQNSIY